MKEILYNMANLHLINFCLDNNVDCSDSRTMKVGRGFRYYLVRNDNGRTIATVTFHKQQSPTYSINPDLS